MTVRPSFRKTLANLHILFLVLLVASTGVPSAHSASVNASVLRILLDGSVSAHMEVLLVQNITQRISAFRIPIVNAMLDSNNASGAVSVVEDALRSRSPNIQASSVELIVTTTDWDSLDREQTMGMTLDFRLRSGAEPSGSLVIVDTAWKSLVVHAEIEALNESVNRVGESYLKSAFENIRDIPRGIAQGLTWHVGGKIASPVQFLNTVQNLTLIDFSGLKTPIADWQNSFDISTGSTKWSRVGENFNLIATESETLTTGETQENSYGVRSIVRMSVQAPGTATAQGNVVEIDASNGLAEQLMLATILTLSIILVAGFFFERRIISRRHMKKRQSR